ncbi:MULTISPECIES: polysialyltransferase family glycosyltransferase [unclassified Thermosipho (in: thermotogales)]|uniref:polysialyltransferase family glycosyltransferase n=1 Tax=unclassified Thermosipho (in: thermotogales) TaxID=2676525 RepID=UPI000987D1ED|nr:MULTISPECIES: polysialyltransferase family glycosyltransferase [unclassified Thermosipho (in: thermotogales)]MBT1247041.1 hypothetical protein [Thermosipho sp. 1244]OOC46900.1 hypothetical protein XO09_04240 [Thermosipho sp. 1223]
MKKIVFLISAYYHYFLAESISVLLLKENVESYSIFFESEKYKFKNSYIFKKTFNFKRFKDRGKSLFFSSKIKRDIERNISSIKNVLDEFSPNNTIIVSFTEYDINNFLFVREAYKRNFKILLHEEGIGTYLVKNNYYKNFYSILLEKRMRKLLNTNDLIVTSPWSSSFVDIKDVFYHFNSKFFEFFILNETVDIKDKEICNYKNKIRVCKLFEDKEIDILKDYYINNYSKFVFEDAKAILYLAYFYDKEEFKYTYETLLKILKAKGIYPVIIKPHPLNNLDDELILKKIAKSMAMPVYYIIESIPGEILAIINENIKYIFSYGSTVSWFLKNFDKFKVFMLFRLFKNSKINYSFRSLEKHIDFSRINLLIPNSFEEFNDILESERIVFKNKKNEKILSVPEFIIDILTK